MTTKTGFVLRHIESGWFFYGNCTLTENIFKISQSTSLYSNKIKIKHCFTYADNEVLRNMDIPIYGIILNAMVDFEWVEVTINVPD